MKLIITKEQLRKLINESKGGEPSIEFVKLKLTGKEKEIYYPIEDAIQYIKGFNLNKEMYCDVGTKKKIELIMNTFSYMEDEIIFKYQIPWTKENKSMKGIWKFDYDKNAAKNDPKQDMINGLKHKFLFIESAIGRCCDGDKFICDNNFNVIVPPKIETEEDRINKLLKKDNEKIRKEMYSNLFVHRLNSAKSIPELVTLYNNVENNYDLDEDYQERLLDRIYEKYKMLGGE